MPYSQQQIEREKWFEENLPKLIAKICPQVDRITVKKASPFLIEWDSAFDGWDFLQDNVVIASLKGFGDKIASVSDVTPSWLIKLCKNIHDQYPFDGIYVNGRFLI